MQEMIESNDLIGNAAALRERMGEKGYLLFRSVVSSEAILQLREDITEVLAKNGWIFGGDKQLDGIACRTPLREGEEREGFFEVYDAVQKLESLYALAHEENLMGVMRQVLGDSAFPHPLSISRLIFPKNNETTTPPHQDYANNQGTRNLTAAWIPLGDCPKELGGVAVLEGSHQFNEILPLSYHLGAGGRQAVLPEHYQQLPWVGTNFKMGDVLLFPALTVHRAMDNLSENQMRISVDFRYQLEGEHLTETVLNPHFKRFDWEEVYKNWQSDKYKYYWRDKDYVVDEWNFDYHRLPDDHIAEAMKLENKYKKSRLERTAHWSKSDD